MEEQLDLFATPEPEAPPEGATAPAPDMMALLLQLQKQMGEIAAKNEQLTTENAVLRAGANPEEFISSHTTPQGVGTHLGSRAARSVTIATRPVRDDPNNSLWGSRKTDPGKLTQRGSR